MREMARPTASAPRPALGWLSRLPGDARDHSTAALALVGALASLTGLAVVAGVMAHNSGQGTDYTTWSWIATGVVWPLGMAASVVALRWRRAAPLAMTAIGLGASFFFVWEYGQAGGVPLAMAGAALLWRRISAPTED